KKLTEEQKVGLLLDRITFGARPGDVERVMKLGWEKYLDEQLHPQRVSDQVVEQRLKNIESVHLSAAELTKNYPPPQVLRRILKERGVELPDANQNAGEIPNPQAENPQASAKDVARRREAYQAIRDMGYKPQGEVVQESQQAKILRAAYSERQLQEVMTDF